MDYREFNWEKAEAIASALYEEQFCVLTRAEIKKIESDIENDIPIEKKDLGGMQFGFVEIYSLISTALTAISIVQNYYMVTGSVKTTSPTIISWYNKTHKKDVDRNVKKMIEEKIDDINNELE